MNEPTDRPGSDGPENGSELPDEDLERRLGELPGEIEPSRDLWPEIEARIRSSSRPPADEEAKVPDSEEEGFRLGGWPAGLAAAATVALIFGAGLLLLEDGGPVADRGGPEAEVSSSHLVAEARRVEEAYEPTLAELRSLVESRELAPSTRETLEESLAVIDRAIEEARDALAQDPTGTRALESLRRMYEAKLDVLRMMAERISEA